MIGPPDASVKGELGKFFKTVAYNIGGLVYSADDIEHGILRGNQVRVCFGCAALASKVAHAHG